MNPNLIQAFSDSHIDFLHDESRLRGSAETIAFPENEDEVRSVVATVCAAGGTITVQGARTGIAGGAVPKGGCVVNLSRLKEVGPCRPDAGLLMVQPGALLTDVRAVAEEYNLFFPPDPTETSASIGGMIAANASGAMSFFYGPTRKWIEALRVVLADGSVLALRRGGHKASGRRFSVTTEDGRVISGVLPDYPLPQVKSATGYYAATDMDLIDLFMGMEGTLGIITGAQLRLIPKPPIICGLTVFLPSLAAALSFVRLARGENAAGREGLTTRPVAIEFFNYDTLNLLRRMKAEGKVAGSIPALLPHYHTAVYLEFHGEDETLVEGSALAAIEHATALGGNDEDSWYAANSRDLAPQKAFRHAVPEAVNLLIGERQRTDPSIIKLGTDMSVPDAELEEVMAMYCGDLASAGLESVIFGHIGNNHVHVNILPRDKFEYDRGKALYQSWAKRIVAMGGSVSAEHGIGKLKTQLLALMLGEEGIAQMRALKRLFDPGASMNPGVLLE
ncbi:MAG: FAD-binding oxidoreductase [bacterium]